MVDVEDRHPGDRRAGPAGGRVGDVVGADDERDIAPVELRVDVLHLLELGIGHVRLREEDVHVPRHPPGDRVDRVLHVDAPVLEELGELADRVLGLRDGEAVARDDDDRARVGELDRRVVDAELALGAAAGSRLGAPVLSPPPNPPIMMFSTDRFMASAMSLVRIAPDAPTRAPPMIRTGLPSTKPAIATAMPVNELSSEMTTGMSAPPIGSVIVTPKISAATRITADDRQAHVAGPQEQRAGDGDQGERQRSRAGRRGS